MLYMSIVLFVRSYNLFWHTWVSALHMMALGLVCPSVKGRSPVPGFQSAVTLGGSPFGWTLLAPQPILARSTQHNMRQNDGQARTCTTRRHLLSLRATSSKSGGLWHSTWASWETPIVVLTKGARRYTNFYCYLYIRNVIAGSSSSIKIAERAKTNPQFF